MENQQFTYGYLPSRSSFTPLYKQCTETNNICKCACDGCMSYNSFIRESQKKIEEQFSFLNNTSSNDEIIYVSGPENQV